MMKKRGQIEALKFGLLISCIVHLSLILLFPGMKSPLKIPPEYLEVSLIRVPPKKIGGETPRIKEVKKEPTVKKILVSELPPLKKTPLPGPKMPILPPYAKNKDEVKVSVAPEFEIPLKREIESSPSPPRFFMEKGTVGSEYGLSEETHLPIKATLSLGEMELSYEGEETAPKGTGFSPIKGPLGTRKILRQREPTYPDWAERQGIEGEGELKLWVLPTGEVSPEIVVEQTSGWPKLDECAIQALRQWKFEPIQGKEVQWGTISFHFKF